MLLLEKNKVPNQQSKRQSWKSEKEMQTKAELRSVVSDSQRPHGLQPSRLLHQWDFPGKTTGVGCHCLLHTILTTKRSPVPFYTHTQLKGEQKQISVPACFTSVSHQTNICAGCLPHTIIGTLETSLN